LTSCVLTYIGLSAGHILLHYEKSSIRVTKFILYAFIYGLVGLILCKFSRDDGWIPINKNLWSLSYILVMASISFIELTILYLMVDVYDMYSGTPFLFLGRNSITIYICHEIFEDSFPFFEVNNDHASQLYFNIYGVSLWCIVAFLMNYNKVFISL
jgi:heparan-alpha-glucosaminide N-acetyltransferase